jgi:hypothetical protein
MRRVLWIEQDIRQQFPKEPQAEENQPAGEKGA